MISVIIPTFNRAQYLSRAVKSVLEQSYQNFEIIIIDDGSTDTSYQLFHNFHPKISYIKQSNQGVSSARNLGIKIAKGEYIAFLDSDDSWHKDKLAQQIKFFEDNPDIDICHGDEQWIRNEQKINQSKQHQKSGGMIFKKCLHLCLISPSTIMLKKALFNKHGLFDESLPACEDYDLWLRLTAFHEIGFINEILITKYGGHSDQLSQKYWGMDRFRIKALEKIINYPNLKQDDREAAIAVMLNKIDILIKGAIKRGNHEIIKSFGEIKARYS